MSSNFRDWEMIYEWARENLPRQIWTNVLFCAMSGPNARLTFIHSQKLIEFPWADRDEAYVMAMICLEAP